jgi:hypothetical protein
MIITCGMGTLEALAVPAEFQRNSMINLKHIP